MCHIPPSLRDREPPLFVIHPLYLSPCRALRPLAEQPASGAALASGEGAARAFRLLVERKDWVGGAAERVRMVTWELLFGLRHEVS